MFSTFLTLSCQYNGPTSYPNLLDDTATYIRVYVDSHDHILLNGNYVILEQMDHKLKLLGNGKGLVLYASENQTAELPKHGIVIDLLKKYKIGIIHYLDKNFTKRAE